MDILAKERAFSEMILNFNDSNTTKCISNTCKAFNYAVKDDMATHYNEYTKINIPNEFEEIATHKMFVISNHPNNTGTYKTLEEYDNDLMELSKKINENNYDDILKKMKEMHSEYMFDSRISRGAESYMYGLMEGEYVKFITDYMNYDIVNDAETDEYDTFLEYI
jgi:hypothetical protein